MQKNRLEAFSDGVLAIIITIMVLELKVPHGATWQTLMPLLPVFFSYVLSFVYVGIYWNNHHHLLHATHKVSGGVMWANLHLLFWLSLLPFVTGWMGENHFEALPTALYGVVLALSALAYWVLTRAIIATDGPESTLAKAVGKDRKGLGSLLVYLVAIPVAYYHPHISQLLYLVMALIWLVPDRRIEQVLVAHEGHAPHGETPRH
jgi:uncharacterized membrane protein